jgi:hypothetical protein
MIQNLFKFHPVYYQHNTLQYHPDIIFIQAILISGSNPDVTYK